MTLQPTRTLPCQRGGAGATCLQSTATSKWYYDLMGSLSLIGRADPDDPSSPLVMHYFDSRGVARLYTVTLEGGMWTVARDGSDFSQRYQDTFSEDGNTITGTSERSDGAGMALHHDFDLVYRRIV